MEGQNMIRNIILEGPRKGGYTERIRRYARTYLMGIEIRIEDNDGVRTPQVDSDPTSSGGEKIYKNIGPMTIKLVHSFLSFGLLRIPVLNLR
jgi:hypothetical protein